MKAVIVDISGKNAVALTKSGDFIKIKNRSDFYVGCEIDIQAKIQKLNYMTKIASIAAAFIIVTGLGFGIYAFNKPYSYIDVDINPSIEITMNVFNGILDVKGLNSDGEKVLSSLKFKFRNIEYGIKNILKSAVKNGYLKTEKNDAVLFTVTSKNDEKTAQLESVIKNSAQEELKQVNVETEILIENISVKSHNKARKTGISAGKLHLIEKLQESDPGVDVNEYMNAPVKEIISEIREIEKSEKELLKIEKNINKEKSKTSDDKEKSETTGETKKSETTNEIEKQDNENNKGKMENENSATGKPDKNNIIKPDTKEKDNVDKNDESEEDNSGNDSGKKKDSETSKEKIKENNPEKNETDKKNEVNQNESKNNGKQKTGIKQKTESKQFEKKDNSKDSNNEKNDDKIIGNKNEKKK